MSGSLLAQRKRDWSTGVISVKCQHTNALGTPVAVSDATGTVTSAPSTTRMAGWTLGR